MKIGAHISTLNGIKKIPAKAHKMGCECFQFFSRSPHGDENSTISNSTIDEFRRECKKYNFKKYYIHAPYFINLASSVLKIRRDSINALKKELEIANKLGAQYIIVHLGSSKDYGSKIILENIAEALMDVLKNYNGKAELLIETIVGTGIIIGSDFKQIGQIISKLPQEAQNKVGTCFDTCHVYSAGYDLCNKEAVENTLEKFDKEIGLEKLKLIHANDTRVELGSHIDRHENIGRGNIGEEGFWALMHEDYLKDINIVIETHFNMVKDIETLKRLRDLKSI